MCKQQDELKEPLVERLMLWALCVIMWLCTAALLALAVGGAVVGIVQLIRG